MRRGGQRRPHDDVPVLRETGGRRGAREADDEGDGLVDRRWCGQVRCSPPLQLREEADGEQQVRVDEGRRRGRGGSGGVGGGGGTEEKEEEGKEEEERGRGDKVVEQAARLPLVLVLALRVAAHMQVGQADDELGSVC